MSAKPAAFFIVLSGAILTVPLVSSATPLVPPVDAVRDSSPPIVLQTQNWFLDLFRGGGRDSSGTRATDAIERKPDDIGAPQSSAGTYRTLCVRLCDGFYWPVSHSTARTRFSKDAKQCEVNCPGRSQLFVQRTGSEDVEGMADLKGIPYTQLKNALRYRTEYVRDCTCRGNPWDAEAIARHRAYAEAAKATQEKSAANKQASAPRAKSQFGPWTRAEARD
jgi:hypothetical protein